MRYWRDASSLLIALRVSNDTSHSTSYKNLRPFLPMSNLSSDSYSNIHKTEDYKILTLTRNATSSFMPSNLVFPGGTVEEVDHSKQWLELFQRVIKSRTEDINQNIHKLQPTLLSVKQTCEIDAKVVMRICAIRETFEESGILIAVGANTKYENAGSLLKFENSVITEKSSNILKSKNSLEDWRYQIGKDSYKFLEMCNELTVVPNVWVLHEWRNWLTPVFKQMKDVPKKPARFNTMFYICCFDCQNLPHIEADGVETFRPEWRSPSEYIKLDRKNALPGKLPPPQTYELEYLSRFSELHNLNSYCMEHSKNGLPCWMPVYIKCRDGHLILLPGDYLYPSDPDYEGTKVIPPSGLATLSQLTDNSKDLHRIVYNNTQLENGIIIIK